MASHMAEVTKNTAKSLLQLVSQTSENLRMAEVIDHFDLIQEVGKGSYGRVLMAKHKHSGQIMAIKMLVKEKTQEEDFLIEYGISLTLGCHPHIIRTHEFVFQTSRDYVLVQELAPAGNLESVFKPKVGIQEDIWKRCVPQIASALDFMHSRGMVHRDLKLNNILLMDAECHWIKLADFGFTCLQGTCVSSLSWYMPYHAPELCSLRKGEQLVLHPSLYVLAFGVLAYIGLTGFLPWHGAVRTDEV